jgi:hypothetical protein
VSGYPQWPQHPERSNDSITADVEGKELPTPLAEQKSEERKDEERMEERLVNPGRKKAN